jgi:hypothetical protein
VPAEGESGISDSGPVDGFGYFTLRTFKVANEKAAVTKLTVKGF